ncbi:Thiol-disulfide isomerase and thioredoxins [Gloeomargarita lithophora Alchichica-D10]|uniref:Thiol-disulfide isomerase and thioredoxins n=1 Tax=Gloeomargarita lithophora Alchichica-D10 TaxID=1188229 RepID=A0A1J0AA21_9CYAN|nr:thioredoxin family protein [Gloeomargarita lithophora]APB32775.1 Thiol-disulfide isomerase and thioredoxins [Gloeomargarita lithophora Alchichica-D10]
MKRLLLLLPVLLVTAVLDGGQSINALQSLIPTPVAQANSKPANVGGPLSQELQNQPVVVDMFATWCAGCQNIKPTLTQLRQRYQGKVNFVVFDVSDKKTAQAAETQAQKMGLGQYFAKTKSQTSTVAIIDPRTGNILAQYKNNPRLEDYTQVLDAALAKSK